MNPNYVRRDLRGLVCHTDAGTFLRSAPPDSCDFVMVDLQVLSPQPHPTYSYMATIRTNPGKFKVQVARHIQSFPDKALLLAFKRSVLHDSSLPPSAVARGLVQMVVDMDAHGVTLSDEEITEADTSFISRDAQVRLILQQLERARASPVAFIIERYDMEAQGVVTFYDYNTGLDLPCGAKPFGFTAGTKAELEKF
ncbi:uncharacterized protein LOC142570590 [Dermacentor variabilis]|uniref:uncharacterized protein LOC142570590 n=1 Tax=Dermacentor variabilis TaxID=34621 RepID=UPI003F5B72F3